MRRIKVLIIDSNILVRRAITNVLEKQEIFRVCWMSGISEETESTINEQRPDVILLSIDSMSSNGLTLISSLRTTFPKLPVIVLTPRNKEGAEAAITALRLGAVDFVTKPHHRNLILFAERHLEKRLAPLINAAYKLHEQRDLDEEILQSLIYPQKEFDDMVEPEEMSKSARIVAIGGCTGGPQTLSTLLSDLPDNLNAPVVIAQHFPRIYSRILAEKLNSISSLNVREAQNGVKLSKGDVWLAPGGYHFEVVQHGNYPELKIHRGLRENNARPSIDVLFRSVANIYGREALGILVSGCGSDGVEGAKEIRKNGGKIIVQDPRSAIAPDLPLLAIKKGLTREYFYPEDLSLQISDRVQYAPEYHKIDEDQQPVPIMSF